MRAVATLVLCMPLWACAPGGDAPVPFEVPRPPLAGMDEAVRRQLEELASRVETVLAGEAAGAGERAAAIAELGRAYHAYDLSTDAEICYREALRLEPTADRFYYLGFLEQVRGNLAQAAVSYRAVLDLEPGDTAARLRLADVLVELGQPEEAGRHYEEVLTGHPDRAAAHRGLGIVAADAGRWHEAIAHFERALEGQPEATSLHYLLARALRALGDEKGAWRHSERAGAGRVGFADPRVAALDELARGAGVRLARGGVALAEGRTDAALEEYRQAVAADPANPAARTNLALLLASVGEASEAREQLTEALRLEPSNLQARLALASLQAAGGELENAIEGFDRILELHPAHAGALRGRAAARLALGDAPGARDDLEAFVASAPRDGAARLQLGSLLQESGDLDGAERHYRAALELELPAAGAAAARLSLGNLEARRGAFETALGHYEAALELAPGLDQAIYNRAGVLARLGRYREAAAAYRRVLELQPAHPAARFYLGDALLSAGRPQQALAAFETVAADDPHHERARLGVAVSLKRLGRSADALASLEESLRQLPRSGLLAHELALTLASSSERSLRDGERALELARRLFGDQPSALHAETLAMALAEAGRFEEAVELQSRLLAEADATGDRALIERLRSALELYRRGEACCSPPSR